MIRLAHIKLALPLAPKPKPINWLKNPIVDDPTTATSHSERLQHLKQLKHLGH
jgi:hypothetical protein